MSEMSFDESRNAYQVLKQSEVNFSGQQNSFT